MTANDCIMGTGLWGVFETPGSWRDLVPNGYRRGTHRLVAPDATFERMAPVRGQMGITRVAKVTGPDRIGIPVVMVCRPNSRSIAMSQGKGLDLAAARASGLMEAIETYHAVRIERPLKLASQSDLQERHALVDVCGLAAVTNARFDANLRILSIEGHDLISQSPSRRALCRVPEARRAPGSASKLP